MDTLRGRPVGLHQDMTVQEMVEQLKRNETTWREEGFSLSEIQSAVSAKCQPLIHGFYWYRNPEAQARCEKALGIYLKREITISFKEPKQEIKINDWKDNLKTDENLKEKLEEVFS